MKTFDFADIEKVNRIVMRPGELLLFQSPTPLTEEQVQDFHRAFRGTPLEGRFRLMTGEWKFAVVSPEEVGE